MEQKLVIGVCAMDIKARSKPMRNLLDRLLSFGEFEVVLFGDHVILEEPIEQWPLCNVLIAFFSRGFPLAKAVAYAALRRPFCVNDLLLQYALLDRRVVLQILDAIDIPTPPRIVVNRGEAPSFPAMVADLVSRDFGVDLAGGRLFAPSGEVEMPNADVLRVGDRMITKPFLEKPVDAEDHNIYIYYAKQQGGGCRRLFRKVANKSSDFVPDVVEVRRTGSFIYEQFLEAENAKDVKVYTVGLNYAHAECRRYANGWCLFGVGLIDGL